MLFTYNQEFRFDRHPTERREAQVAHLEECLSKFKIDKKRIVYVGAAQKEGRVYVPESAEILRLFFGENEIPEHGVVLSDNGKSFSHGGIDTLLELGFERHVAYPAAVHQYLSPNDNHFHGAAKKKWRESGIDFSDDVLSCCALLHFMDDTTASVPAWFDANMQLGKRKTDLAGVESLIKGTGIEDSKFHRRCLREYRTFEYGDARGGVPDAPPGLESRLDGVYWTEGK